MNILVSVLLVLDDCSSLDSHCLTCDGHEAGDNCLSCTAGYYLNSNGYCESMYVFINTTHTTYIDINFIETKIMYKIISQGP